MKRPHTIRGINFDAKVQREKSYAEHLDSPKDDEESEIFYHGTTKPNALHIIENGIILTKGGKKMDFSNGDGFYVDHDLDRALEWSIDQAQNIKDTPMLLAVLVYRVKRAELRHYQGLNLTTNSDFKFPEVVTHFRNGEANKQLKDALFGYHFIEGPWSAGPWRQNAKSRSTARASPLKDTYQLCLKSDESIGLFNTHLKAVVYFEFERRSNR